MRPDLRGLDRPSQFAVGAALVLTLFGIGVTLSARAAADTSTPVGVVTAYVRAIQAGDADSAWVLLAPRTSQLGPESPVFTRDTFRQQVQSSRQSISPLVRVTTINQSADTTVVELEVTHAGGNPLTVSAVQQSTVTLARQPDGWRIISEPMPWAFQ